VADQYRPGQLADSGRHLLSVEKANPVRMVGGGAPGSAGYYNELVNYAVRFTFSGDYYHRPLVGGEPGHTNVSHGCVNLPPGAAVTYYNMSIPGDPITVTASTAAGKWDDGWTMWFCLVTVREGERTRAGRAGRTERQHVRLAVVAARQHRHRAARHLRARQLLRPFGEPRVIPAALATGLACRPWRGF